MVDQNEITFTIAPRAARWVSGADVEMDLRVENRSSKAIEIPNPALVRSPQPVYRLRHPSGETSEFTPAGPAARAVDSVLQENIPMVRLEQSQSWVGDMLVNRLAEVGNEGFYELSARLTWNGLVLNAAPVRFEIQAASYEQFAINLAVCSDGAMIREALLLQRAGTAKEVIVALLADSKPMFNEMKVGNLIARGGVPAGTTELLGPYANYEDDLLRWVVARQNDEFYLAQNLEGEPGTIKSDQALRHILTPLATRDQSLILLAITDSEPVSQLLFARVAGPGALSDKHTFVGIAKYSTCPNAAVSVLGPEEQGSPVAVVSVTLEGDSISEVTVARIDQIGERATLENYRIDGLIAVQSVGAHIDRSGTTRLGFLALLQENPKRVAFVEMRGKLDSTMFREIKIYPSFEFPDSVKEVRIGYCELEPGRVSRAVLIRDGAGSLIALDEAGAPRACATSVPRDAPIAIVPAYRVWFVVFLADSRVMAGAI